MRRSRLRHDQKRWDVLTIGHVSAACFHLFFVFMILSFPYRGRKYALMHTLTSRTDQGNPVAMCARETRQDRLHHLLLMSRPKQAVSLLFRELTALMNFHARTASDICSHPFSATPKGYFEVDIPRYVVDGDAIWAGWWGEGATAGVGEGHSPLDTNCFCDEVTCIDNA